MTPSITEKQVIAALRTYLLSVVPVNTEVIRGLDNRVSEPVGNNFITMTPILRERLEWNTDTYTDTQTLSFTTLTAPTPGTAISNVANTAHGTVLSVSGLNVLVSISAGYYFAVSDVITGVGTVTSVAYGSKLMLQPTKMTIQLDVHGAASGDNAQMISTTWRDQYAVDSLAASGSDVAPLYAGEPRQMSYLNGEQQIEERWVVDIVLQANIVVAVPVQLGTKATIVSNNMDVVYPWNALLDSRGRMFILNASLLS